MNLRLVGNFKNWIEPEWVNFFTTNQGQPRPTSRPMDDYHIGVYKRAEECGYDMTAVHFWYFKHTDVPFKIIPPWLTNSNNYFYWWMVKMFPSQFMHMHQDPDVEKNVIRYWMPWTDYEPGHVFIINEELITNYKAGDVFAYVDQGAYHGSCNIGYSPRFVLQVTEFLD